MNWTLGYNTDYGYTYGYYREQDPAWLDLCALAQGVRPPQAARLRYLELGCGQGLNLCLIAALHPDIDFVGIDFNPQHIAHAEGLASAAGLRNVRFVEASFTDLAPAWPAELGRFHYAAAHGILSWIARPVRDALYRCLTLALEPGALVYLSYNTLPGWLPALPLQHLLRLWQKREALPSLQAIDTGRARLQTLLEANIPLARTQPTLRARLDRFPQLDKAYLVQEYLHDVWTCFWFDELAQELEATKLRYLRTATASDWYLAAMLPPQWKSLLAPYKDPIEREVMLDVLVNQSFRRDIWANGHNPIWPGEQMERLRALRVALLTKPQAKEEGANPYKFATSLGEVEGKAPVYGPLYEALAQGPKGIGELMALPVTDANGASAARTLGDTLQAIGLMLHASHIALAGPAIDTKPAKALNRAIAAAALAGAPYRFLVASAVPTVLSVADTDVMLLGLWLPQQKLGAEALGRAFAQRLRNLGRGLAKDGQPITNADAFEARAIELAQAFLTQTVPNWQRLGVV